MSLSARACGAFAAGVVSFHFGSALPDAPGWCLLLAGSALLLRGRRWLLLGALFLGMLWSAWHAAQALEFRLDERMTGQITVAVAGLPVRDGHRLTFNARITGPPGKSGPRRARLHWYGPPERLEPGERWQLEVDLRPPAGALNPGGFDTERWLMSRRIDAVGSVTAGRKLDPAPRFGLDRMRDRLSGHLRGAVNAPAPGAMLVALAVGDRRFLDDGAWETLLATGTNHLVAISGLHVGLAGGLGVVLGGAAWRLSARLTRRVPASVAGAALGLMTAGSYAALAGFTIPTQRALIMLTVALLAVLLRRPVRPMHVLALAATGVLVLDPLAPLDPGFWLSFTAVAVLGVLVVGRAPLVRWWRWGTIQVQLALVLAPLTLVLFSHAALVAPLANVVAIPLVGLFAVPLVLLATATILVIPPVGEFLAGWSAWLLALFLHFVDAVAWLGDFLPTPVMASHPTVWVLLAVGLVLLLLPSAVPGRPLGVPVLVAAITAAPGALGHGEARVTVLDVGHGHATVIETQDAVVVVDTGATAREVNALLTRRQPQGADRVVLTRERVGHRGGREGLNTAPSVVIHDAFAPARDCTGPRAWGSNGVTFRFLDSLLDAPACALLVDTGRTRLLVAAGVEPGQAAEWRRVGAVDALILPSAGHRDAVEEGLLEATQPQLAIISVDADNRHGLPHEETLERLRSRAIDTWITGRDGAIVLAMGADIAADSLRGRARWWNRREPFGREG